MLEAGDVHLRDMEFFRDVGLRPTFEEAEDDDLPFARGEAADGVFQARAHAQLLEGGVFFTDVVFQARARVIVIIAELVIQRHQLVEVAEFHAFQRFFEAGADGIGHFLHGGRAVQLQGELLHRLIRGEVHLLQAARHFDSPAAVAEVALDLPDDGGGGEGGETDAAFGVKAVNGMHEANGAHADEVIERLAAVGEFLRQEAHEIHVIHDQLFADDGIPRAVVAVEELLIIVVPGRCFRRADDLGRGARDFFLVLLFRFGFHLYGFVFAFDVLQFVFDHLGLLRCSIIRSADQSKQHYSRSSPARRCFTMRTRVPSSGVEETSTSSISAWIKSRPSPPSVSVAVPAACAAGAATLISSMSLTSKPMRQATAATVRRATATNSGRFGKRNST
ncbi:MAG: hypothetical protein BWY76_01299 [bacterium ADurb.Bin429]|nr:MAG: hypothetical protein BWY76_01299 [bacterium ADurb.Bin429]